MNCRINCFLSLLAAVALAGCVRPKVLERQEFTRVSMGVPVRLILYAPDREAGIEAAAAAFEEIARLDAILSDYRRDSELMRLCAGAGGPPVPVSDDLIEILARAQSLAGATDGAFDVTVGPAVRLWRESRRTGRLPENEALAAARSLIGSEKLILDPRARTVRLIVPGMQLDLGGIGKGYAAQRATEALRVRGLTRSLVALAGDIVVGDPPPGEAGWRITIALADDADRAIVLANAAVSTSGDLEQHVEIGGVRYSHIVDPRTGIGVTTRVAAAVVAPRGELADALASAICVLGPAEGARLIESFEGTGAIIEDAAGGRRLVDPSGRIRLAPPESTR